MAYLAKSCLLLALLPVAIACGCYSGQTSNQRQIKFKDDVETNVNLPANVDELEFLDTSGHKVNLNDFIGKQNVVFWETLPVLHDTNITINFQLRGD